MVFYYLGEEKLNKQSFTVKIKYFGPKLKLSPVNTGVG